MNRFHARAGNRAALALALILAVVPAAAVRGAAADTPNFWFAGTKLILARTASVNGALAVSLQDPGFASFLTRLGATVSWQPGERYIVFTAADRHVVSFTLGDAAYKDGSSTARAPFAAYAEGDDAFVPFLTLARALYVAPVPGDGEVVLEPQLAALDVRAEGPRTLVTLRGAIPLRYRKISETSERVQLAFPGVGSSLAPARQTLTAGLSEIDIATSGTPRNPTTVVTFDGAALSVHALYPARSANEITLGFAPQGIALAGGPIPAEVVPPLPGTLTAPPRVTAALPTSGPAAAASTAPFPAVPAPAAVATGTMLTAVDVARAGDGAVVTLTLSGPAIYEWHRLGDDRWYADFRSVALAGEPDDEQLDYPAVQSVRVRQIAFGPTPVVRVALTLSGSRAVRVDPTANGATITVDGSAPADLARSGSGALGGATVANAPSFAPPASAPIPPASGIPIAPPGWKFGASPAPPPPGSNPRLIVIDPGHGGTDTGAMHNGLVEKVLTLDIGMRLRSILVSRGWIVKMTRETDRDVVAPNDDARTELQGRCDIANNAGARLFVSVHINAFTGPELNGTTTYYYKGDSEPFAADVERRLIPLLGTKDDGVKRANFYVVRHTTMPSILVETAFLSNPDDAAKLRNPAFLERVAEGIADGIGDFAGSPKSAPAPAAMTGE